MQADSERHALRFLRTAFEPDDWIALFLKSYETGRTMQRVGPLSLFLELRVHAWLRAMNAQRYSCYVSVNSIKPGVRSRTKAAIDTVRHVFLDIDQDGPQLLAAIATRRNLPPPSYVIESSPNRLHVLWRVSGFTTDGVERLQKYLTHELGTDPAATPCSQTTRLAGYRNHKYAPAPFVTIEYGPTEVRYKQQHFQMPSRSPAPCVPPTLPVTRSRGLDVVERARRYLAHVQPAVAGQHGDVHTFRVCCRIVRGFALSDDEASGVLADWNARCLPPWTELELRGKHQHARHYGQEQIGTLAETRPSKSN